jgi:hypothetical protein
MTDIRSTSRSTRRTSRPQRPTRSARRQTRRRAVSKRPDRTPAASHRRPLGRYADPRAGVRELVVCAGAGGSVLVLDRDAVTHGDRRLVAHLAPDEPPENACIVARCYLAQAGRERCRCRPLVPSDLRVVPFCAGEGEAGAAEPGARSHAGAQQIDRLGRRYRLARLDTGMSIRELRWCRLPEPAADDAPAPVSVREVIAALESYQPVRTETAAALAFHERDAAVSVTVLRAELTRVLESPIVLNRGLREAVLAALQRESVSMSEIAMRCGRVKRDPAGNESGETSWLARRLGLLPEGGRDAPTPWVHSDVLALVARDGLGISPREVELG